MIIIAGVVLGAAYGALTARRRGGKGFDMLQYGASFAIALGLLGLLITIVIGRMAG